MKQFFQEASVAVIAFIVGVALLIGIGLVGVFGYGWFIDTTANRSGKTQVKQQINGNGAYRIAAYDSFFNQCADVQTDEVRIQAIEDELTTTTDAQRKIVLQASLTAAKIKRGDDINGYNADSSKAATKAQFKASDLPFTLDSTEKVTICHA